MVYVCLQLAFVIFCGVIGNISDIHLSEPGSIPFIDTSFLHILLFFVVCAHIRASLIPYKHLDGMLTHE